MTPVIRDDVEANARYIKLRGEGDCDWLEVEEIEPGTFVDIAPDGTLIGIEVLSPGRPWAFGVIADRFDLDAETRAYINQVGASPIATVQAT